MRVQPRWWLTAGATVLFGVIGSVGPAHGQTAADLDVKVERDTSERTTPLDLGAYHTVTITEKSTGGPPAKDYAVFNRASNASGDQTEFYGCEQSSDSDSRVPRGIYGCTVFVDYGGAWELTVVVNEVRTSADEPPKTITTVTVPFEMDTTSVYSAQQDTDTTSTFAVVMLQAHVGITFAWFVAMAALVLLAVPNLRRRLSDFGLYRLERRIDSLVRATSVTTLLVVGTGIYLLANETAYQTPFSVDKAKAMFNLPYAEPYFLSLGVKLGLYALMLGAAVPLAREARRRARLALDVAPRGPDTDAIWPGSPRGSGAPAGTVLVAQDAPAPPAPKDNPTGLLVTAAIVVLVVGAAGISVCITLLKYFHQIIEAV